jgi:hypothetical protein
LKKKEILDPLWLTKGSYLDPEYFSYILLAASKKYREDIETGDLEYFYELFFHSLNLNTLAVEGQLRDFKMHPLWNNERISKISKDLKQIFIKKTEVVEIFRNANYTFLNLMLDYMDQQLDVLDQIDFFYLNQNIHQEETIFLVTTGINAKKYTIWKIEEDEKGDFRFNLKKIKTLNLLELSEGALREELDKLQDPRLDKMIENTNVCFAISEGPSEKKMAIVLKDIILLNKGLARGLNFEPLIINEMMELFLAEKLMPFTLNQWIN